MNQLRAWNILIGALMITAYVSQASAQSDALSPKYYPEASLVQIYTQEQIEQKKAAELEEKALQQRDLYEKQKREVEQQISAHRYQIEGLKMQQEKAQSDLDLLAVDLQHVNGDLASYQAEHQQLDESTKATIQYLEGQRAELSSKQKSVDLELKSLSEARRKAEHEVYQLGMDIERFKSDISKTETRVQEAEAKRAALEADEMKIRADWMQAKMQAAEHFRQRDEALAQLADAKKRFETASQELNVAKMELAKAEKSRTETGKRVKGEVEQYEREILASNKARVNKDAERQRMEMEIAKIQDYDMLLKETRDQTVNQQAASEGLVLKTSLALESARNALGTTVDKTDQASYQLQKIQHQARGLAAADEASQLVKGGRSWVTSKKCNAYPAPTAKSATGFFEAGKHVVGKDHGTRWVEIMNGAGSSVYMERGCGHYED